jgi:hypothetical protein
LYPWGQVLLFGDGGVVQGNVTSGAVVPIGTGSSFGSKGQTEAFTIRELGSVSDQVRSIKHDEVGVTGTGCLLLVGRWISGVPLVAAGS